MCVAVPGEVVKIENGVATINYDGNFVKANAGVVNVKVGDYALVHAGLIIQVMDKAEVEDIISLFKELEDM